MMETMTPAPPVCIRCGYDLRLIAGDAACPECGLAVHRSIGERPHPDDCPPAWVRRMAVGALLLLIAYLGGLASTVLPTLVDALNQRIDFVGILVTSWALLVCMIHFIANVLLAKEDKGRNETPAGRWQRRALWFTVIPVLWASAGVVYATTPSFQIVPYRMVDAFFKYTPLCFMVMPALSFERLRRLALRLSRPRLAEHIRIVAVGSAVSTVTSYVVLAALFGDAGPWILLLSASALACAVLFILWGIALLFFITPRFFVSAAHAREKWRLADAAVSLSP